MKVRKQATKNLAKQGTAPIAKNFNGGNSRVNTKQYQYGEMWKKIISANVLLFSF